MRNIIGISFCILGGILTAKYGWIALLWLPIGFIIGLFSSSNIILPILSGVPLASSYISKKQMRPRVYLALFRTPLIWLIPIFLLWWFFPSAIDWISKNDPLWIGMAFGCLSILLSPLSKKSRDDFHIDFDKTYGKYYTDPNNFNLNFTDHQDKKQLKQIEAAVRISSNLYLETFSTSPDVLNFKYADSRFRCMIFCLSTMVKSCEDLLESSESLQKECLHFLTNFTTSRDNVEEYFSQSTTNAEHAEESGGVYFNEYMQKWITYYDTVKVGEKDMATDILCSMIHSFETDKPMDNSDKERLNPICGEIEFSLYNDSLRGAFIGLMAK
jgi:hypothetical protein